MHFVHREIRSRVDLTDLFADLVIEASHGLKPIIHIDMHGSETHGLRIAASGEDYPWQELYNDLQRINIQTANNLVVVAGVCHALRTMFSLDASAPCAAYIYIAPQGPVSFGFLEDNTLRFYRDVLNGTDLVEAYDACLSEQMRLYHCEKLLFILIAGYIKRFCRGAAAKARRESLLTQFFADGRPRTKRNFSLARALIKEHISPKQELIDQYANAYLIGRPCGFTLDDVLCFIRGESA
jgi:hypothetical protein